MYLHLLKKNINSIHQELTELWQFYCQHQIILCFLVWQTHVKKTINGEYFVLESDSEKACFQVLYDLDHVAGKVKGSTLNQ